MPYFRKTLSTLRTEFVNDIKTAFGLKEGLLRFSNLSIIAHLLAAAAHMHNGFLDWIARQAVPFTSTGEYQDGWAALKDVYRKAMQKAKGKGEFNGIAGATIPKDTEVTRDADGATFLTVEEVTYIADGMATVDLIATDAGIGSNTEVGTSITLSMGLDGVESTGTVIEAITGGTDTEDTDSFFDRMMFAYQMQPCGGAVDDYKLWAMAVHGVTRVWVNPNGAGAGTVIVYAMLDDQNAAYNGFPQGTDGVATLEYRSVQATGDQLAIADYIYADKRQPVTALVSVVSPIAQPIDFTITGLSTATVTTKLAIANAIKEVFEEQGEAVSKHVNSETGEVTTSGSLVELSYIEVAIAAIADTTPFVITSPTDNPTTPLGYLPTLGAITYAV